MAGCGGTGAGVAFLLPNAGVPWTGCTRGARGWESTLLAVVRCGYGVGLLCWGSEGESGRVWLGSELGTHGVHGVEAECDGSLASLQGSRGGVGLSAKLRVVRRASGTSHTCWGAVMEKSGVGVLARPGHGELRHGNRGVRRCCAARSVSSYLTGAERGDGRDDTERGQLGLFLCHASIAGTAQCGGVLPSTATGPAAKLHVSSVLW